MNVFQQDLVYSYEANSDKSINNAYFKAFPHLVRIEVVESLPLQMRGIDKILHFSEGNSVNVDEKKRRKDYGDILLEEYSNWQTKRVGWLGKTKYTDYITYVIEPTKQIYFFPFLLLQRIWLDNYHDWIAKYGRKFAKNDGYVTSNVAIPKSILLNELQAAFSLSL